VSDEEHRTGSLDLSASRLEAFSDAVMAVIITIMAFGLRAPKDGSFAALQHRFPNLFVYILSFAFVAIYWNNHHHLLRAADRISGSVMWANSFLLFWLSLMPVLTAWLSDQYDQKLPAACYGIVALAAALAYSILVRTLIRANGKDSLVATAIASDVKGYASLALYAAGIGLAAVSPWIAYVLYAAVSVVWWIPDRRFTRAS
jgi:TMEM175 potassium channel family protein